MSEKEQYKYNLSSALFIKLLGAIYFFAFISLSDQVIALIGSHGIIPAQRLIEMVGTSEGAAAPLYFPTLFWLQPTDSFLQIFCYGGVIASIGVATGILTVPALILCWLFWLSLVTVGGDFLSFQWDALLLEAGFLAMFLPAIRFVDLPLRLPKIKTEIENASSLVVWLFRFLLFRLMFESGVVKLKSGDPSWWELKALDYHYLTQPLPTPLAWFSAKLPPVINHSSVFLVFAIELLLPLFIFLPRKCKLFAAIAMTVFQVLIALTGNYAYFNLLTICLCLFLVDDRFWLRFLPKKLKNTFEALPVVPEHLARRAVSICLTALIVLLSVTNIIGIYSLPGELQRILTPITRLNIVNNYGLFAVMTTERKEIILEGSDDGINWKPYEFKYKPGELNVPPCLVAPLQPRLDWQMWFASLAPIESSPWFSHLIVRIFRAEPEVLHLFKANPFQAHPPQRLRAQLYDYKFSGWSDLLQKGQWWERDYAGPFMPEVNSEFLRDKR